MGSEQVPIFESGLFGKANSIVCNSWTDAARIVAENAEGIRWAQSQVVGGHVTLRFLAKITSATALAANRWTYAGTAMQLTSTNATSVPTGSFGTFSAAVNIRELRNTTTLSDGTLLDTASIGPVGSEYVDNAWKLTGLEGYVEMVADYNSSGGLVYWFDCVNPSVCTNS
jgi:hypothetical protein